MTDRYRPCAGGNIGARYERVEQGAGLRYGIIEVTTRCQLRCPGCYMVRRSALNKGEMSFEQAVHILDLCKEYRGGRELETMDVLGGEPLLWSHLRQFVEELIHRDILPWIFTNMVAITPEVARGRPPSSRSFAASSLPGSSKAWSMARFRRRARSRSLSLIEIKIHPQ